MDNFENHIKQRTKGLGYGFIDFNEELYTYPLWNLSGQLVGYQRYNWKSDKRKRNDSKGRYWTYITKQHKCVNIVLAGIELVDTTEPLFLVEGVFEILAAHSVGINAVATLTNNPKHLRNWLYCYPHKTIALCQNDEAGSKLKNVCDDYSMLTKDLDEYSYEELLKLKELINTRG